MKDEASLAKNKAAWAISSLRPQRQLTALGSHRRLGSFVDAKKIGEVGFDPARHQRVDADTLMGCFEGDTAGR